MSNIIVAAFETPGQAAGATKDLNRMIAQRTAAPIDACVVIRKPDGALSLEQMYDRPGRFFMLGLWIGGIAGFFCGLVLSGIGMALFGGLAGALSGLGLASVIAASSDYGIDDDFINKIGSELAAGCAALIVLHRPGAAGPLIQEIQKRGAIVVQSHYTPRGREVVARKTSGLFANTAQAEAHTA